MRGDTFFDKQSEDKRVEQAFIISGGTNADRYAAIVALKSRFSKLKHRFESHDNVKEEVCVLFTNQPLKIEQTEKYVRDLAQKQGHVKRMSSGILALS